MPPRHILARSSRSLAAIAFSARSRSFYAIEARAAGYEPVAWHALSVVLHITVSLLVYTLARRRGFAVWTAIAAAMLFLLHGSRPEAVTWIAAQFDLWAAFFVLIALLAFDRGWHAASLAPLLLALLSKESAYVYPLLLLLLLRMRSRALEPMAAPRRSVVSSDRGGVSLSMARDRRDWRLSRLRNKPGRHIES